METIANKIVGYLDKDENIWSDVERAQMLLGLQVLIHNIVMIGMILIVAEIIGIFREAVILLTAYGMLKTTVGGIHFKKSAACLLGTGIFVIMGVMMSHKMNISLINIIFIYIVCMIVLVIVGPQGTENNPISEENHKRLKRKTVYIVSFYLFITIFMAVYFEYKSYLLFVAVVFETFSLLPLYIKNGSGC